jgi:DNA-directed RNA polymerase subunit M
MPKKSGTSNEATVTLACFKCGYAKQEAEKKADLKTRKTIQRKTQPSLTVISEEDQKITTLPTIRMECAKCGNNLVFVWQVQTRGGDEASTQFMRCTKCGHTFREYS